MEQEDSEPLIFFVTEGTEIKPEDTEMNEVNRVTELVIGAAIEVHRDLGPGLLESAYQKALQHELTLRGVPFVAQKVCSVTYKGLVIDDAYRLDLLIDGKVVVELKALDALSDVHSPSPHLSDLHWLSCRLVDQLPRPPAERWPASPVSVTSLRSLCPL